MSVGGACGEILSNKTFNILDKSLESVFGYISVLPDAFSAYRYKALLNGPSGNGPLAETMHAGGTRGASLNNRNIYLGDDRTLCFDIVTKKNTTWVLKYVISAKAVTGVPTMVPEFISPKVATIIPARPPKPYILSYAMALGHP